MEPYDQKDQLDLPPGRACNLPLPAGITIGDDSTRHLERSGEQQIEVVRVVVVSRKPHAMINMVDPMKIEAL